MSNTQKQNALARQPEPLAKAPQRGYVTINGKRHEVQIVPTAIRQHSVDSRPSHYETLASRGVPQQSFKAPTMPSLLQLSLAAIVALSFVVAASMFSISLTAYSNSVDRVDANRQPNPFITVE